MKERRAFGLAVKRRELFVICKMERWDFDGKRVFGEKMAVKFEESRRSGADTELHGLDICFACLLQSLPFPFLLWSLLLTK